jgi:phosphoribosylformylglycinamidine synthase subunit PurL
LPASLWDASSPAGRRLQKIDNQTALRQLLRDPTIASKNWVYRQYDHTVRTGTLVKPGSDAAVFFVRYANKILAATTDCNSTYCALDPREGGKIAVAEAARNLTCSGAKPLALTDCLNFGNPYKPRNFWQLREAVEGVAEACREFGTPITGGNVSLYNESPAGVVDPTPTIAMVGLIDHENQITTQWFKNEHDAIILVGTVAGVGDAGAGINDPGYNLGGSQYLKVCHGLKIGPPPHVDLPHEIKIQSVVRDLIREGLVKSAHDCSEGGLAVALAECCFNPQKPLGADICCSHGPMDGRGQTSHCDVTTVLFNESQSRIVISVAPENLDNTISMLRERKVPFEHLGKVGGDQLQVQVNDEKFAWSIANLYDDWWNSIRRVVGSDSSAERIPSL